MKLTPLQQYCQEQIWLPPTLSRVLTALWEDYWYNNHKSMIYETSEIIQDLESNNFDISINKICKRKLLKDDKTEATLFDQDEETQKTIAKLFIQLETIKWEQN